ncbi:MAG: aminopeptidase, partial [Candidatus Hermodarchaeota archaeon]
EYFAQENEKIKDSYEETLTIISNILGETESYPQDGEKKNYYQLFYSTAQWILKLAEYERVLSPEYFSSKDFDTLFQENQALYSDLFPENYETSYANPSYCVKVFGDRFGQLMSFFYVKYRTYIQFAFSHQLFQMEKYNKLFIDVFQYVRDNFINYDQLEKLILRLQFEDRELDYFYQYKLQYDPAYRFFTDIIEHDDLSDFRYLFKTGRYISDNEIKIAQFMVNYSEPLISRLAKSIVAAYIQGFKNENKDYHIKSTVMLYYPIGMEKLYREVIRELRTFKLEATTQAYSTDANKQYNFDHKFDTALYYTEEFEKAVFPIFKTALEQNKDYLNAYSGNIYVVKFGEPPFSPNNKPENLKMSADQTQLYQRLNSKVFQEILKYRPQTETSFCMIAFPTPEIGDQFEEIFAAMVEINMLDSNKYEKIQQIMVDELDKADRVHIKGKDGNETDLIVKVPELKNPEIETNFANVGADVNIPVGEVLTTPRLAGTNGILHVEETYQGFLRFDNLKLTFKDGFVVDYSCTNFEKEEENKKYIEENLLFPHKTLPMSELAIGTNTLAYVASKKYNILNVLPVLIVEKTGPHFAIGDTCYSRQEDHLIYNRFNKKAIVAVDNEKSILRKTDKKDEAYTYKHEDITLAFDSLKFITAITAEGDRIDIIRDGQFVLKGTEELNIPLIEYQKELERE